MLQRQDPEWVIWPVSWSAIWVGRADGPRYRPPIGLVGLALGANEAAQYVDWKKLHLIGLIFSVGGAFFGYVAGGWARRGSPGGSGPSRPSSTAPSSGW